MGWIGIRVLINSSEILKGTRRSYHHNLENSFHKSSTINWKNYKLNLTIYCDSKFNPKF